MFDSFSSRANQSAVDRLIQMATGKKAAEPVEENPAAAEAAEQPQTEEASAAVEATPEAEAVPEPAAESAPDFLAEYRRTEAPAEESVESTASVPVPEEAVDARPFFEPVYEPAPEPPAEIPVEAVSAPAVEEAAPMEAAPVEAEPAEAVSEPEAEVPAEAEPVAAPVVEEPAPVVEAAAPVAEEPAPVMEAAAPAVEEPAPALEEPAPVEAAAEPVAESAAAEAEHAVEEQAVEESSFHESTPETAAEEPVAEAPPTEEPAEEPVEVAAAEAEAEAGSAGEETPEAMDEEAEEEQGRAPEMRWGQETTSSSGWMSSSKRNRKLPLPEEREGRSLTTDEYRRMKAEKLRSGSNVVPSPEETSYLKMGRTSEEVTEQELRQMSQDPMWKTLVQFKGWLPVVTSLLPVLDMASGRSGSGDSSEIKDTMDGLLVSHRDVRATLQNQTTELKRVEEEVAKLRDAADKTAFEQSTMSEDVRSMQRLVKNASLYMGILLGLMVAVVGYVAFLVFSYLNHPIH